MVGIRKKKKQETRTKILTAAKKLFLEQGYDETTTNQIAEEAEVGAGTIFNYFESKGDILMEAMADEMGLEEAYDLSKIEDLDKGVSDIVFDYMLKYVKNFRLFGKKFLREVFTVAVTSYKKRPEFFGKLMKLDYKFMGDIRNLLESLQKNGALREDFDLDDGVETIYGAFIFEFTLYIYNEDRSIDVMLNKLKRKLDFIFHGYVK